MICKCIRCVFIHPFNPLSAGIFTVFGLFGLLEGRILHRRGMGRDLFIVFTLNGKTIKRFSKHIFHIQTYRQTNDRSANADNMVSQYYCLVLIDFFIIVVVVVVSVVVVTVSVVVPRCCCYCYLHWSVLLWQ